MAYAIKTTIGEHRTLEQIRSMLSHEGADRFGFLEHSDVVEIAFELKGRRIRYRVPLPKLDDYELTPGRKFRRTVGEQQKAYRQAVSARWRAIHLLIRAKLEAVELGVLTFEEAFLAETVLSNGETMGEWALPSIRRALSIGETPQLLGAAG